MSARPGKPQEGDKSHSTSSEGLTDSKDSDANILWDIIYVVNSVLNLDLFYDAQDRSKDIDWRIISYLTFDLGKIGLMVWSCYVVFVLIFDYIMSSGNIITGGSRILSFGVLAPAALLLAVASISRTFQRISVTMTDGKIGITDHPRDARLILISLLALLGAVGMRGSIYVAADQILGANPFQPTLVGFILLDIGYISLLLIGIGGLTSVYFRRV